MFKFGKDASRFKKKTLPKDFAQQLLNLEMEIELNEEAQIETFQDLISLYMVGVEYYESIKDKRYQYFERKLKSIMKKPSFMHATDEKCDQQSENQMKRHKYEEEHRRMEMDLIYSQTESKEVLIIQQAQVKEIVELHTEEVKKIENIIKKDMAQQSDQINQRIERRRRSKMTHSHSQPQMSLENLIQQGSINQIKQEIQQETIKEIDEPIEEIQQRKKSIHDKKWEIIQNAEQKKKQKIKHRHSLRLTTKQLMQLTIRRRYSADQQVEIYNREHLMKQLFIDQERIDAHFNKRFK